VSNWHNITKEEFSELIYKHSETTRKFSKEFGVSKTSMFDWMNKGKIPRHVYTRLLKPEPNVFDKNGLIVLPRGSN
jgi:hypothetical protein